MPTIAQGDFPPPKSWDEFEDIVADLYRRIWNDPGTTRYGRSGQPQQGVDIYGQPERLDGGYVGIQCKRLERGKLTRATMEQEIAKAERFTPPLAEYIIATTDRRDGKLQKSVREISGERRAAGQFPVAIVFWEDLCSLLAHPDQRDILVKHYGDWFTQIAAVVQSLHQIPAPPRTFKGREEELDELVAAIREGGVSISGERGMGGIGKTALALKLAERLAPDYADAQIFVNMKGTSRSPLAPVDVMGHVIRTFYPQAELPASESDRGGLYDSVLHDKKALLLLDDAASGAQIASLIPPASCALLATSRTRFRIAGMHALDLDTLKPKDARALLCEIAPRIGDAVDEIAELCGYLPLALELAARALAERVDLGPDEYAARLRDERKRLGLVDASFSLSYDLLEERLQKLWARLSVFSIPFGREAAAAVWEMGLDESLDQLGELLRYSLIDWRQKVERYDLHNLARLFAYGKLEAMEDPRPVHRLAAEHFEAKLTQVAGTPEEALEEVDQWERAEAWERLARRASALVGSLDRVGYWVEIEERLVRALEGVEEHLDGPSLQATLLNDRGMIAFKRAEWDRAIAMYQQSFEALERVGDVHGQAATFNNLGLVYADRGEWDRAIEMYQQSLEAKERVGDVHGMAQTFNNLGIVYQRKGEWDRAIEYYEKDLEISERVGDVYGQALTWGNLGLVYADKGEWDRAVEMYEQSLEIKKRMGDTHGMATTWSNLGSLYADKGEWERAIELFGHSLQIFERVGDERGIATTLDNLGLVYADKEEWDRASDMYQRSLRIFRYLSEPRSVATIRTHLGQAHLQAGRIDEAKDCLAKAYIYYVQLGLTRLEMPLELLIEAFDSLEEAYNYLGRLVNEREPEVSQRRRKEQKARILRDLGGVATRRGSWQEGRQILTRSIKYYTELKEVEEVARTFCALAELHFHTRNLRDCLLSYSNAIHLFNQAGNEVQEARILETVGLLEIQIGEEEDGLHDIKRAIAIYKDLGDSAGTERLQRVLSSTSEQ